MFGQEIFRRRKLEETAMTVSGFVWLVLQLDKALSDRFMNVRKDQVLRGGRLPGDEQEKLQMVATSALFKEVMLDVLANEYFTLSRTIEEGTALILKILSNPKHPAYEWARTLFLESEVLTSRGFERSREALERHRLWDKDKNLHMISMLISDVAERIRKEDGGAGLPGEITV